MLGHIVFATLLVPFAAEEPIVTVRPPEELKLEPGQRQQVTIDVVIQEGFHVQANPAAQEFLIPLEVTIEAAETFISDEPRYPEAGRLRLKGTDDDLLVYDGTVSVPIPIRCSAETPPGAYTLRGSVEYQACDDVSCRPPATALFELQVRVSPR